MTRVACPTDQNVDTTLPMCMLGTFSEVPYVLLKYAFLTIRNLTW